MSDELRHRYCENRERGHTDSGLDEDAHKVLRSIFERIHQAGADVLSAESNQEFISLYNKFQESQFYLVFLGQFKRGKTTLLNALLGVDLLPTGVLPLTSIVTIVRYGGEACGRVEFLDGHIRQVPLQELPNFVTERGNPRNRKRVAQVEVTYPAAGLADGLCLVDTPGIGSVFEHNTQISYGFVPQADAAIFVFSPESPLSQLELQFLHHIRAHVERIFFVLNKADQVNDSERNEILEFARQTIRQQMPSGELRFYPVSARRSLDERKKSDVDALENSNIPQLARALRQFLAAHKGDFLVRSTCSSLRRLIQNELLALELEERACAVDAAQLQAKIQAIEETWQALDQRHREAAYILRGEMRAFEASLEKRLNEYAEGEVDNLARHLKTVVQHHLRASRGELVTIIDQELRRKIAEVLEDWKTEEEKAVAEEFEALTARFSSEAAKTVEQIQQVAAEQFGFTWIAASLPDRLTTHSTFRIKVDEVVSWGLGQFPLLLPGKLFVRYLANRMGDTAREELYRNVGRLKADLGDRLEQSVTDYLRALDRHVERTRASVRQALQRAATIRENADAETSLVAQQQLSRLQFLRRVDEELAAIQARPEKESLAPG
jgi:GTPase SAR1 family protein